MILVGSKTDGALSLFVSVAVPVGHVSTVSIALVYARIYYRRSYWFMRVHEMHRAVKTPRLSGRIEVNDRLSGNRNPFRSDR